MKGPQRDTGITQLVSHPLKNGGIIVNVIGGMFDCSFYTDYLHVNIEDRLNSSGLNKCLCQGDVTDMIDINNPAQIMRAKA